MTQDRRITDKLPTEPLEWGPDQRLIDAALQHLVDEKTAACIVHVPDSVPQLHIAIGTKDALRGLLREDTASQSQAVPSELARLKQLAMAATPGPWAYQEDSDAYTHIVRPVASPSWIIASCTQTSKPEGEANGRWIAAANPATILKLIEQVESLSHSAATGKTRPTDDHLWDETLRDRDTYHDWADKLADAIAKHFGVDIGEHSNMNCPWAEALEAIENASPAAPLAGKAEKLDDSEQYRMQMAAIASAAIGYRVESTGIKPEYDTVPLRDMARLFAKYEAWRAAAIKAGACAHCMRIADDPEGPCDWIECPAINLTAPLAAAVPAECSGTPSSCPENEGHGCHCGYGAPAEPAPILASALTEAFTDLRKTVESAVSILSGTNCNGWANKLKNATEMVEREVLARLSKPTSQGTAQSIDTDEFRELMCNLGYWAEEDEGDRDHCAKSLIEFIDRHIAAQAPAGRDATHEAIQRACRDLPEDWEISIELERGSGCVMWCERGGDWHAIDGEGFISDDIIEAIEKATADAASKSHAAEQTEGEK